MKYIIYINKENSVIFNKILLKTREDDGRESYSECSLLAFLEFFKDTKKEEYFLFNKKNVFPNKSGYDKFEIESGEIDNFLAMFEVIK